MKMCRIFAAAMGMVMLAPFAAPALAQSPLADAARREAARRQAARTASIPVYTNQDLDKLPARARPIVPPLPVADATAVTTAGIGGETAAAATEAEGQRAAPADARGTEKQWRERMTAARSNLSRAVLFGESLQSRINALSTDFINRDDPAQRGDIFQQRQAALAELTRVQAEIAAFRQEIADIEEEARRAGVPPGWLR